ncbi:MAG: tRNA (N6-isopentenyl adenosine(37)-C2)-methylthiotransferase MiaB [Clostridia bacterium]|nr:tRNA (N6-isopentenyl adenosine(37)-C2)-methylthiotransferase MiaB [Clostridia bacterium]
MGKSAVIVTPEEMNLQKTFTEEIRHLPQKPKSFYVVTYGCQMNAHDSEKLAGMLKEMDIREAKDREDADFVIFNTCCVRENAERRALGNVTWLKEVRKRNPGLIIAVCGCMIQEPGMAEKILQQYKFINLAFGTSNLHRFPELLYRTLNTDRNIVVVENRNVIPEGLPISRARKEAAYITVMYGCDNFCSYCIVPYVRGRERSRETVQILHEAEGLLKEGVQEVMLLGQNVNSYGKDLSSGGMNFAGLLRELDRMGIPRIRFMTSHPRDLSDELIETMSRCVHVLPQFHLPVQSGSNRILKEMNRHYTREQYLNRVVSLRKAVPGIGLSTDIIVGFPGETESDFNDTMTLVDEVRYDSAFTFVFSPRIGTKAARMDGQIDPDISKERIQKLIVLQEKLQQETMKRFVGMEEEVLIEGFSRRSLQDVSGKGRHGISVTVPGKAEDIGTVLQCRITGLKNNTLTAERSD